MTDYNLTLSTTEANSVGVVKLRHADTNSQVLKVQVIENGLKKSFKGLTPFFCLMAREVTGQGISEEPVKVFDSKNGTLEYTSSDNALQMIGRNEAYFSFRKQSGDTWIEQFSTRSFHYIVEKSIYSQPFKDSNYWWTFKELYDKFIGYQESGKQSWEDFVNDNKEILEAIDPGGIILSELINSRGGFDSLSERLKNSDSLYDSMLKLEEAQNLQNSLNRLVLVDSSGTLDQVHPKVLKFKKKWNGYYWWIAFTPYGNGDAAVENPHILASNNMKTWVEPAGYKNPLDPQPSNDATKQYNSDTHLVFRDDLNRLECWWRFVDEENNKIIIYRRTTSDGISWTDKEEMINWVKSERDCVCPVIIFEEGKYKCWFINAGYKMWYMDSTDGIVWSKAREVVIHYEKRTLKNWHHDIIRTEKGYEMVIVAFEDAANRNNMNLYYSKSSDGLTDWEEAKAIIKPAKNRLAWDNRGLYRSSILYDDGVYYIFYSGINTNGNRGIGISYGSDPTKLKGYQNLEAYILDNMKAFNMVYGAYLRNYGLKLVSPQAEGDWTGVLNFNNSNDMKLAKKETTSTKDDLLNLIVKSIKSYEGILFQGVSAWLKSDEYKMSTSDGVVGYITLDGNGDFKVKRASGGPGGLIGQTLTLEDNGVPQNVKPGTLRWSATSKKFMYYDGSIWKELGT